MNNPFSGIITANFKQTFNNAIDSLLERGALTTPCQLSYNSSKETLCYNCIFDPILDRSSGQFNSSGGTVDFPEGSACPICMGVGKKLDDNTTETIHIAVILDSKYWLNTGPEFIHIPNMAAQTLCKIDLMPKINNATYMTLLDNSIYDNTKYYRAGFPTMMGLGSHQYILTNWTKQ
jgi:hypothetical protein